MIEVHKIIETVCQEMYSNPRLIMTYSHSPEKYIPRLMCYYFLFRYTYLSKRQIAELFNIGIVSVDRGNTSFKQILKRKSKVLTDERIDYTITKAAIIESRLKLMESK